MQKLNMMFESLVFEVRYGGGHLYFDRCGSCLVDIERECEGWAAVEQAKNSGTVNCFASNSTAIFDNTKFVYSTNKAFNRHIEDIGKEASRLWKIVQANLGIEELVRIGCRITFYLPCLSIEEAERRLEKAEINVLLPDGILSDFKVKSRQIVVTFESGTTGYRVDLKAVTRVEGMPADTLLASDPKYLPSKQREARIARLRAREDYIAQPTYTIDLDVDCFESSPERVSAEKFIAEQFQIVDKNFVPFLKSL